MSFSTTIGCLRCSQNLENKSFLPILVSFISFSSKKYFLLTLNIIAMKKTLLVFSLFSSVAAFSQNCTEIFISEYVEGTGNDKALELYNPTGSAINLSGYRVERFSNGDATSANGGILNLSGSIAPYSTFVVVNGQTSGSASSPAASPALQAMADLLDGAYPAPTYMNGNDAIALFKGSTMIDLMGKIGDASMVSSSSWSDEFPYDGSVGAFWTKDQTLYRKASVKAGVTVNPDPFIVITQWDSLPKDTWTGLGSHTCECFVGIKELTSSVSFVVYPNPSIDGQITVSADENIEAIEIVNMLGQVVVNEEFSEFTKNKMINTALLTKGMYTVKLHFSNNSVAHTNLVVQ